MHYKLIISKRAELHIDNILDYVVNTLKNPELPKLSCLTSKKHITDLNTWQRFLDTAMTIILPIMDISKLHFQCMTT